jgi:Concanavalin A-like lectin/glucanases superfamily
MATVTGLTADRMLEIEAASVVDGDVIDGELILTKHDGTTIDAGSVAGPPGPVGPIGSDLEVLVQQAILDIGIPGQIRAGRMLTLEDFSNIGLVPPVGLWNFSGDFTDSSGNGLNLTAKATTAGNPTFERGIDGVDSTAVQFNGTNALYINDSGAADPLRLQIGSFGAWVRTAKQGANQSILTKRGPLGTVGYYLRITTANVAQFGFSDDGTATGFDLNGLSKICDNRWHFIVGTYDGVLQNLYVDGILEASALHGGTNLDLIFTATLTEPFNIGGYNADTSTAPLEPSFGRVDEAFVTEEVLSQDKVFNLYCAKIPHTLGSLPSGVSLNVYPGAKGASLVSGDFPSVPLRLYNFSGGSLGNEGSNSGAALTATGAPISIAGVDGTKENAYIFNGNQRLTATDAGLPAGTSSVSYGCWFKCSDGATALRYILNYGGGAGAAPGTSDTRIWLAQGVLQFDTAGATAVNSGIFVADGAWHFVVVVHDSNPADGLKRKFYLDGRLIASASDPGSIVLASPGATNKFVIAASISNAGGTSFLGQIDTVFVIDQVLLMGEINKLYTKSLIDHLPSPKNAGDHVQAMSDEDLLVVFDTLDIAHKVSLKVMS